MTIGIYSLYWEEQGLVYIGQSIDLEARERQHINSLKDNTHTNFKVQNAYCTYGKPKFIILEKCTSSKLQELEIVWTNEFNSLDSLNIVNPVFGIGNVGENNLYAKYTKLQYLLVFRLLLRGNLYTVKDISIITKVSETVINSILYGRKHKWIQEKYPFLYSLMVSRNCLRGQNSLDRVDVTFINQAGIKVHVTNLTTFAKDYGLTPATVAKVYRRERNHHKGWKIEV